MSESIFPRRQFLKEVGIAGVAAVSAPRSFPASVEGDLHISSNEYSWTVFYQRENRNFKASLETALGDLTRSSLSGLEPGVLSLEELDRLGPLLKKNSLEMRSVYVDSTLHDLEKVDENIGKILKIAEKAKSYGTRIIVTNPSPIRWGGPEDKDDSQLRIQVDSLNQLGQRLVSLGLKLAYHNHDIELRNAAREFHHMMVGTDPKWVSLCLDAHWVYRGAGNSSVALFDVLQLYGPRVVELHLRQSVSNVWSETLAQGDIDYPALAERLIGLRIRPHLVMEIAVEKGTPQTLDPVEAHRRSVEYARKVFAGLA
jgi:inosose dehydratase